MKLQSLNSCPSRSMSIEESTSSANNRSHDRTSFRTAATVLEVHGVSEAIQMYTDDISASGVKLTTREEIKLTDIYLKILMPGLEHQLVCGKIVRHEYDDFSKLHQYAVKFARVCTEQERQEIAVRMEKHVAQVAN